MKSGSAGKYKLVCFKYAGVIKLAALPLGVLFIVTVRKLFSSLSNLLISSNFNPIIDFMLKLVSCGNAGQLKIAVVNFLFRFKSP